MRRQMRSSMEGPLTSSRSGEREVAFGEPEVSWRTGSFDSREHGLVYDGAQIATALASGTKSQLVDDADAISTERQRGKEQL